MIDGRFQRHFGRDCCLWRSYAWEPAAVSLGYNQDPGDIDSVCCKADGVDVVVRPTGGRAVFHADEFTYSFHAETEAGNGLIYRAVHEIIRKALEQQGIVTDFSRSDTDFRKRYRTAVSIPCFTASAKYELQAGGRKLVGSAQRRRDNILLQHGSLPFTERHKEISRYIRCADPALCEAILEDLDRKTVSLSEITSAPPGYDELVKQINRAAGEVLHADVIMTDPVELETALELNNYATH
jgi:lipoate-protein ligase A